MSTFSQLLSFIICSKVTTASWTTLSDMSRKGDQMALGVYNGKVFLIGGYDYNSQAMTYDTTTLQFTDLGQNALSGSIFGGKAQYYTQQGTIIYMIDRDGYDLNIYNMATDQFTSAWHALDSPVGSAGCLASTSSHLYVTGGDYSHIQLQVFSLSTHQWLSNAPDMKAERRRGACIVENGYLWAFGGDIDTNERIQVAGIISNSWAYVDPLSETLSKIRCASWSNTIYIIGGENDLYEAKTYVHVMDAITGSIRQLSDDMPAINEWSSPIVIGDILYVFGGFYPGGTLMNYYAYYTLSTSSPTRATINPTTNNPSSTPTTHPTPNPTNRPTPNPTRRPTANPFKRPTNEPTVSPTRKPTSNPTRRPTTNPTRRPTPNPTRKPTANPFKRPTNEPTVSPTRKPTSNPTRRPTTNPTRRPTPNPTRKPTSNPTRRPTTNPTRRPTPNPTRKPTSNPTRRPTSNPTRRPTLNPTRRPTLNPTRKPTPNPTVNPTPKPTDKPTPLPTKRPNQDPTVSPTPKPTYNPTKRPSPNPTGRPTNDPSNVPSTDPSVSPTRPPSTRNPTTRPTNNPSKSPTTPSPTPPGAFLCGETVVGEYNGQALDFTVLMTSAGDITFDMSYSTFTITVMEAFNSDNQLVQTDHDRNQIIHLTTMPSGWYKFTIYGNQETSLTYDVRTTCTTKSPTPAPTNLPSDDPTLSPTFSPTDRPTDTPSDGPTPSPIYEPTSSPTMPTLSTVFPTTRPMVLSDNPTRTATVTIDETQNQEDDNYQDLGTVIKDDDSGWWLVPVLAVLSVVICGMLFAGVIWWKRYKAMAEDDVVNISINTGHKKQTNVMAETGAYNPHLGTDRGQTNGYGSNVSVLSQFNQANKAPGLQGGIVRIVAGDGKAMQVTEEGNQKERYARMNTFNPIDIGHGNTWNIPDGEFVVEPDPTVGEAARKKQKNAQRKGYGTQGSCKADEKIIYGNDGYDEDYIDAICMKSMCADTAEYGTQGADDQVIYGDDYDEYDVDYISENDQWQFYEE
eukprot:1085596_1